MSSILNWLFKGKSERSKKHSKAYSPPKLGVVPDEKDDRDYSVRELSMVTDLPTKVDLSQYAPGLKNQGGIGSCGSFAAINCLETLYRINGESTCELSEMFHYYEVRQDDYEGSFPRDSGQTGRNAMKVLQKIGSVPEKLYPYYYPNYNKPPKLFFLVKSMARFWRIMAYYRCNDVQDIKFSLANNRPVWIGIPVQNPIFCYKSGVLNYTEGMTVQGGHAMECVGYDDDKRAVKVLNSWAGWGTAGYGWISYDYFETCPWCDFWSVELK